MKRIPWMFALLLLTSAALCAQSAPSGGSSPAAHNDNAKQKKTTASAAASTGSGDLDSVLNQMDTASANFRSAEADFVWDQYQKIIEETETQKGKVYFRRSSKDTQMAANISEPDQKQVVYSDGLVRLYQPKIDQITEHSAGKNKAEIESFLVLGFGGRGHDLLQSYEVKYAGSEVVDGVKTQKLELTPKAPRVRNMFDKIVLWIDPTRDISLKQQLFEPAGDYRLAHYSNIKLNAKIPDDTFKIKTTRNTKIVRDSE